MWRRVRHGDESTRRLFHSACPAEVVAPVQGSGLRRVGEETE